MRAAAFEAVAVPSELTARAAAPTLAAQPLDEPLERHRALEAENSALRRRIGATFTALEAKLTTAA